MGYGLYNSNNRTFTLLRGDYIENDLCNIKMNKNDKILYSYTKKII